ncbi:MAG: hypothetical protein HUJ63_05360, partial [Enterococcus sp.]|nr:hypothetical protein [Enterococcus sp.]
KKLNEDDGVERLYWTVYMNKPATLYGRYECQLEFDDFNTPNFLYLRVKDTQTNQEERQAFWDLNKMRRKTATKMKNLVICYAETKQENGKRYFNYKNFECYFDFSFDKFLDYLRNGLIQVDFRIGADIAGKKAGIYHDHGTGFRIQGKDLLKLYNYVENF